MTQGFVSTAWEKVAWVVIWMQRHSLLNRWSVYMTVSMANTNPRPVSNKYLSLARPTLYPPTLLAIWCLLPTASAPSTPFLPLSPSWKHPNDILAAGSTQARLTDCYRLLSALAKCIISTRQGLCNYQVIKFFHDDGNYLMTGASDEGSHRDYLDPPQFQCLRSTVPPLLPGVVLVCACWGWAGCQVFRVTHTLAHLTLSS